MPEVRLYKKGSIIYFESERKNTFAYLLKDGVLTRDKFSLETNTFEKSQLVIGEFFGIKGALGVLPRDESISVVKDATVYIFTTQEFVQLISKNVSIIFKMMKAFSNELRHIHHAIENLLTMESNELEITTNAAKLKNIGDYYLKKKRYSQAVYAFKKFLEFYPKHGDVNEVKQKLSTVESILGVSSGNDNGESSTIEEETSPVVAISTPKNNGPEMFLDHPMSLEKEGGADNLSKEFNDLVMKYKTLNFIEAKKIVTRIDGLLAGQYEKIKVHEKFLLLRGKVSYFDNNFNEAIESSKLFVKNYPTSIYLPWALLVIAESFIKNGNVANGKSVYNKIVVGNCPDNLKKEITRRIEQMDLV